MEKKIENKSVQTDVVVTGVDEFAKEVIEKKEELIFSDDGKTVYNVTKKKEVPSFVAKILFAMHEKGEV